MVGSRVDREVGQAAATLRRRLFLGSIAREALPLAAVLLFVSGGLVLLARHFAWTTREQAAWFLVLAAVAPVVAWIRARARAPSREACVAWLDLSTGGSGLLLAAEAPGAGPWLARTSPLLASAPLPPSLGLARRALVLVPAVLFAGAALAIEITPPAPPRPPGPTAAAVAKLREDLAALDELGLDPAQAAELEQRAERLDELAKEGSPEATWEALDAFESRLADEAERAAEKLAEVRTAIDEALASGDADAAAVLAEAARALEEAGLSNGIPGLELPEGARLDAGALEDLARAMQGGIDGKLADMLAQGLLDASDLPPLEELDFSEHEHDENCPPGGT